MVLLLACASASRQSADRCQLVGSYICAADTRSAAVEHARLTALIGQNQLPGRAGAANDPGIGARADDQALAALREVPAKRVGDGGVRCAVRHRFRADLDRASAVGVKRKKVPARGTRGAALPDADQRMGAMQDGFAWRFACQCACRPAWKGRRAGPVLREADLLHQARRVRGDDTRKGGRPPAIAHRESQLFIQGNIAKARHAPILWLNPILRLLLITIVQGHRQLPYRPALIPYRYVHRLRIAKVALFERQNRLAAGIPERVRVLVALQSKAGQVYSAQGVAEDEDQAVVVGQGTVGRRS